MLNKFFKWQTRLSRRFDKLFPDIFRKIGNAEYKKEIVPRYLKENQTVYDIGGGKLPYLDHNLKSNLSIKYVGVDISEEELMLAPKGLYDDIYVVDIAQFKKKDEADLIICQNVLEHVADVEESFKNLHGLLKKDGIFTLYVPSRNSLFARINLILPQVVKEKILYTIMPQTEEAQGFPAFYNKTTIKDFIKFANDLNMEVLEVHPCFLHNYFKFFLPFHMIWRIYIVIAKAIFGDAAAISFSMVLKK